MKEAGDGAVARSEDLDRTGLQQMQQQSSQEKVVLCLKPTIHLQEEYQGMCISHQLSKS